MKAFLAACFAIVLVSTGAYFVLNAAGFSTQERTSSSAVRTD